MIQESFIWLVCLLPFLGLGVGMAGNKLADVAKSEGEKSRLRTQRHNQESELSKLEYTAEKKELLAKIADLENQLKNTGAAAPATQESNAELSGARPPLSKTTENARTGERSLE